MGFLGLQIQFINLAILLIVASASSLAATPPNFPIAKPNCTDRCGNVRIPFPFGTTEDCYQNYTFFITCNQTFNPPQPFMQNTSIEITDISLDGQLRLLQFTARDCDDRNQTRVSYSDPWINLPTFITVNNTANKLTIVGCDASCVIYGGWRPNQNYRTGCTAICSGKDDLEEGSCTGLGCCSQISNPKQVWRVQLALRSYENYSNLRTHQGVLTVFAPKGTMAMGKEVDQVAFVVNHLYSSL